MSVMTCNFYAKTLGNYVDVSVYIPSYPNAMLATSDLPLEELYDSSARFPSVYLLHGMLDDHTSWINWTTVIQYAQKYRIALIMPSAQNSFYLNFKNGPRYYDFISTELPLWAEQNFPLMTGRENRYIAGLSMGGYGAFRHGLSHPEKYAAIGCFSGGLDVERIFSGHHPMHSMLDVNALFGGADAIRGSDNDLYTLAEKCAASSHKPPVYIICGTEDLLCYETNRDYAGYLKELGFEVSYHEMPGGHEWSVWNQGVIEFLDWIINKRS